MFDADHNKKILQSQYKELLIKDTSWSIITDIARTVSL